MSDDPFNNEDPVQKEFKKLEDSIKKHLNSRMEHITEQLQTLASEIEKTQKALNSLQTVVNCNGLVTSQHHTQLLSINHELTALENYLATQDTNLKEIIKNVNTNN